MSDLAATDSRARTTPSWRGTDAIADGQHRPNDDGHPSFECIGTDAPASDTHVEYCDSRRRTRARYVQFDNGQYAVALADRRYRAWCGRRWQTTRRDRRRHQCNEVDTARCLQSRDVAGHGPSDASHELNALLLWLGRGQRTAHRRPVNDQTRIALTSFIRAPSNVITKSSVPPHWWVAAVTCCTMSKLDGNSQKRRESESSGS